MPPARTPRNHCTHWYRLLLVGTDGVRTRVGLLPGTVHELLPATFPISTSWHQQRTYLMGPITGPCRVRRSRSLALARERLTKLGAIRLWLLWANTSLLGSNPQNLWKAALASCGHFDHRSTSMRLVTACCRSHVSRDVVDRTRPQRLLHELRSRRLRMPHMHHTTCHVRMLAPAKLAYAMLVRRW